jgi:NADH-quinone oxidoreductase subunit J
LTASTIIFYLLAAFTLVNALLAVSTRQIFRAAIYLLFCLIGIAGIYFWMAYDFIAAVQIIVYAGGITVLIIFSIFLTQQAGEKLPVPVMSKKITNALAAFCSFALVVLQIAKYQFNTDNSNAAPPTVLQIGTQMLDVANTGYALPFELVSMLLLAALVGCIVIAKAPEKNNIPEQTG